MKEALTYIALVDDHILLRNGLASLINSFPGYKVCLEADNGNEFIRLLPVAQTPDIVLLDITMPGMNGFETAAWIKANAPQIKILVLSMMDNENAIISMLKEGARGYLLKDSKPRVVQQALNDVRDRGYFMNELVSNKMLHYITGKGETESNSVIANLSEKEITFLKYACTEKTYKEIAAEMGISPRTVEGYRDTLFEKLGVVSRVGLVVFAIKNGLYKL